MPAKVHNEPTSISQSQRAKQNVWHAYQIVTGTPFGHWLLNNTGPFVFSRSEDIIRGFAPHSTKMQTVKNLLLGIEISDHFKKAITEAVARTYQAVFTDIDVRKDLMDWPDQPQWEDVQNLAQHAEKIIAETYTLAGHRTHARPITSQNKSAGITLTTLASTTGSNIAINMHPDAWKNPRTPVSLIGNVLHEHHHCLQDTLIKSHRAGKISHSDPIQPDIGLLSYAAWLDTLTRKLTEDWYSAQVCEKDAHYLSTIFQQYAANDGGDQTLKDKARLTYGEQIRYWCKNLGALRN